MPFGSLTAYGFLGGNGTLIFHGFLVFCGSLNYIGFLRTDGTLLGHGFLMVSGSL